MLLPARRSYWGVFEQPKLLVHWRRSRTFNYALHRRWRLLDTLRATGRRGEDRGAGLEGEGCSGVFRRVRV